MKNLSLIGRILFAVPLAIFGLFHFVNPTEMSGMVPSYFPFPVFWVILTGAALIAAAVSLLIQKYVRLSGLLLAVMLVVFVVTVFIPKLIGGDQYAMVSILKDLGLAGGALVLAGIAKK
jgi:putative oxidoreductase